MRGFACIFAGLLVASIVAWAIQPLPEPHKTPLVWISDDNPMRRAHIELFNRLHPECDLRLDAENVGPEKVIVQSTGGVGPDLFDSYGPFQLASFIDAGIAWDVTDALKSSGVDLDKDVWDAVKSQACANGRVWGFPSNVVVDVLLFNKDVFDKAGVAYPTDRPWTWEEFLPLAKKLTVLEPGKPKQYGFYTDELQWRTFFTQWGAKFYSPDGTRCTLDSPQSIAAMQFVQDLIYKYKVMPSPSDEDAIARQGGWGSSGMKFIGAGNAATAIGGRWWLCTLRNYQGLRLGAVEQPHGPLRKFHAYGKSTCINAHSPRREEALKFLRYMTGPEYNHLINQQADGLAPVKRYCTDDDLINPRFPDDAEMQRVCRDAMQYGECEEYSPFVNNHLVERIVKQQYELIRLNAKSPADAMRAATDQINAEIQKAISRDPDLKARYDRLVSAQHEGRP